MNNIKDINIGDFIMRRVTESGMELSRICKFMKATEEEINMMYLQKSMDSEMLLRWSKLLQYDFFRIYSQHIILYTPLSTVNLERTEKVTISTLPEFRKNLYTFEIINFIMEILNAGEKTVPQIIEEYKIPRTTLYKWIKKYKNKTT